MYTYIYIYTYIYKHTHTHTHMHTHTHLHIHKDLRSVVFLVSSFPLALHVAFVLAFKFVRVRRKLEFDKIEDTGAKTAAA